MPELPTRMRRNGRAKDSVFDPAERLFRRYNRKHIVGTQFSNMGLSLREPPSLNRERYSQASDVLFSETDEFASWGVWSLQVQHLPAAFPPQTPEYGFAPDHDPVEDNYAHTLVICDQIPPTGGHVEPRPEIRKLFRAAMSQRLKIEIEAQV